MTVTPRWLLALALSASACGTSPPSTRASTSPAPTFTRDIAPIFFSNCAPCHRAGQSAPFALLVFEDAKAHAQDIAEAVAAGHMPPWLPEPNSVPFVGERRLTSDQRVTIARWVSEGQAEGAATDLPPLPTFKDDWQLGAPDLIVTLPRAYSLAPGTGDVFRNVIFPLALPTGRFVRAVEFQPGTASVVHHAVISLDRTRASRRRDGADGQPGFDGMITQDTQNPDGHFLGWTPGRGPIVAPAGLPWRLERGSDLVVQLHLLPGKSPVSVRPRLGLYLTDAPPTGAPVMVKLGSKAIDIPAGTKDYAIDDSYVLPVDVDLLSVYPHAHYLGKEMLATARRPDGVTVPLLHIQDWDFHWQQDYRYATPIALPKGTTISMRFTYDNATPPEHAPPRAPGPIWYGPRSSDEMGDLWLQVLPRSAADARTIAQEFAVREARANVAGAEMLMRHSPDDPKTLTFLGSSYAEVGRSAEARQYLERALTLDPRAANAHNYLAGLLMAARLLPEALAHFQQAAALAPDDERMSFNFGNALNAAGRPDEAARAFRRAIAINPEFAPAHQNLGVYYESRGQLAEAIVSLTRAVALAPDSADAHSDLGAALAEAGRVDQARVHLRKALDLNPAHAQARENLRRIGGT